MLFTDERYPEIMQSFLSYWLNSKGRSEKTIDEYTISLRLFFQFMKHHKKITEVSIPLDEIEINDIEISFIETITKLDVYGYFTFFRKKNSQSQIVLSEKESKIRNRDNDRSAIARKASILRSFYKYLVNNHLIKENIIIGIETAPVKRSLPKYLELDDSKRLLHSVGNYEYERNYAILLLFLTCGMRVSELQGISLDDINKTNNTIKIIGKGNKERIVYLNDACIAAINAYLAVRAVDRIVSKDKNALFISRNKRRLSVPAIQLLVKKTLESAGLGNKGLSVHKLRHTAATLMYQTGKVDILAIKEILGHSELSTTEIYTHLHNDAIKKAMDLNPLVDERGRKKIKI